jgi:carbamoyltransferase
VQSVDAERSPAFYNVIRAFEEKTGCAVVVNTSFNVRGEPIVCSPEDAYRCFMRTGMELLVMEECVLEKSEQPPLPDDDKWQQEYELD